MKEEAAEIIEIRMLLPSDEGFIARTWIDSFYYGNLGLQRLVDKKQYFEKYRRLIAYILAKPTTNVRVACLKENNDYICAYAVLDNQPQGKVLHWLYCRPSFRRFGIAKDLVPKEVETVTHMTEMAHAFKPKHWVFDPYLI